MSKPADKRFWKNVNKTDSCWLWTAGVSKHNGYGSLRVGGKKMKAHRFSWELHFGPIPIGLIVMHECDVPRCVRPNHLRLGTMADNCLDRDSKNRFKKLVGEQHGCHKLTELQVLEIRSSQESAKEASVRFGVTPTQIYNIRKGKSWASAG